MVPNVWQVHRHYASFAAQTSTGANGLIAQIGPFGFEGRVRSFQVIPTSAAWASAGTNYRSIRVLNGGTNAAGTVVLASADNVGTVAIASLGSGKAGSVAYPATGTAGSSGTFNASQVLQISQITVGAADASATVLPAGYFELMIESIGG